MSRSLTQGQWDKYSKRVDDRRQKQLQACFEAGVLARREGRPMDKNPYSSHGWRLMFERGWQHQDAKEVTQ